MWVAIAVSLDASGVALCIGLNEKATIKNKVFFSISFAFFQFLLSFLGGFSGKLFSENIASVPSIIGGIIISVVGVMMIKEGMENEGDSPLLNIKMYFLLGISVSIDAMVVGFATLHGTDVTKLLMYTLMIGLVTLVMCTIAFIISKHLSKIKLISKYADYIGGIILILFGLKMMFL
jgi:putative Mn2+ efflux pump MntP